MGWSLDRADPEARGHRLRFTDTDIPGVVIVDIEPVQDDRGFFARTFADDEFERRDLNARVVQCSLSFNRKRGTLRGMHLQSEPWAETKLVRCTRGRLYDVALDLRPGSATYRRWVAVELSAETRRMLYIPEGVAHGFQTLEDDTEVFYQISNAYHAEAARGVRWNDSSFAIRWPLPDPILSERDRAYPDFR